MTAAERCQISGKSPDPREQSRKALQYPDLDKPQLLADGYIAERSGHSRGATIVDWNRQGGAPDNVDILVRYDQARFDAMLEAALAAR